MMVFERLAGITRFGPALGLILSISTISVANDLNGADANRAQADSGRSAAVERKQPQMRAMQRDYAYYKEISCNQINTAHADNDKEQAALNRRKQDCMGKYKAFLPKREY